jgi:benzylsuccinate CoA-transferase BbsF subunit
MATPRPLDGLRILDFSHVLAGPFATRVLGDMGADVVKINSISRAVGANDPAHPYYLMWNRNKRALALDMSNPESRPLCRKLCEQADVVIDNFSVGVLDRWGVGYDEVSAVNPGVIYVQMSGMGDGGPWSKYVTYAPTIHALAGLTHMTGIPGREDIGIGFSYNDHQAGLHGAFAMLAALAARHRTGKGQRIDVSQFEVGVNFAGPALLDLFANGHAARPCGNDLPYDEVAPHNVYQCAPANAETVEDQRWVAIACMQDAHWQALVNLLGKPSWAQDVNLQTAAGRVAARAIIDKHIGQWTQNQDAYAVMAACQAAGVPAGVVQDGIDLVERDPQLAAAGFFAKLTDVSADLGQTWVDHLPIHFHKTPCNDYQRVRTLGEDNADVLRDWLGMSSAEIDAADQGGLLQ